MILLSEMPLNGAKNPEITEETPERLHLPTFVQETVDEKNLNLGNI